MKEHRMARPSEYVWGIDQGIGESKSVPAPIGDTLREIAALEKRRVARDKSKAADVVVGSFFRVDRRWFRVLEKLHSPYGSRWSVQDVTAPDSPSSIVPWTDVQFVAAAD